MQDYYCDYFVIGMMTSCIKDRKTYELNHLINPRRHVTPALPDVNFRGIGSIGHTLLIVFDVNSIFFVCVFAVKGNALSILTWISLRLRSRERESWFKTRIS